MWEHVHTHGGNAFKLNCLIGRVSSGGGGGGGGGGVPPQNVGQLYIKPHLLPGASPPPPKTILAG